MSDQSPHAEIGTELHPGGEITGDRITAANIDFHAPVERRLVGSSDDLAAEAVRIMDRPYVSALDLTRASIFATLSVRAAIVESNETDDVVEALRSLQTTTLYVNGAKPAGDLEREIEAEVAKKRPARKKAE